MGALPEDSPCPGKHPCLQDDKGPEEAPALASLAAVEECAASIKERGDRQLNTEQRIAVASVLLQAGGAAPYALFGPPGTGKTVTLVECALQVPPLYSIYGSG